jgi:hypothetical protein
MLQRTHDATHIAKFACQFAPAVEPGELAHFGYSCLGGRFVDAFVPCFEAGDAPLPITCCRCGTTSVSVT